ncbi:MAG: hypothetical protein CMQ20_12840 [Gammaproteobacteria bacterium]|jgi:hypothetical protein|nr:hypothetical protein [Gammaproteobacteria bacterium]|tara:strand:+ start:1041 stop:2129 length:1089 start_codon:yes stop_codon:yes gene_type:complete
MNPLKLLSIAGLLTIASCASPPVVELQPESVDLIQANVAQDPPLNVSVIVFARGTSNGQKAIGEKVFTPVRSAEVGYLPFALRETLVESGHWGAVRVIPELDPTAEVLVTAEILSSNGVELRLHVRVSDSTGRIWVDQEYSDLAIDHGYDFDIENLVEPFQDIFNKISNDIYMARKGLSEMELIQILDTAMLRYAIALSPKAFAGYLTETGDGVLEVSGLPARNDLIYARVKNIRESEYAYIDTVDEQFENFYKKMQLAYAYWRRYSFELIEYSKKIEQAGSPRVRSQEGSWASMEKVYRTYRESKMNEDSLREMAASFDAEISPTVTELEGTVIRLNGSLRAQYEEWRRLLREIYAAERGS